MIDSDRIEISGHLRDDRSTTHIAIETSNITTRLEASTPVRVQTVLIKPHLTSNIKPLSVNKTSHPLFETCAACADLPSFEGEGYLVCSRCYSDHHGRVLFALKVGRRTTFCFGSSVIGC